MAPAPAELYSTVELSHALLLLLFWWLICRGTMRAAECADPAQEVFWSRTAASKQTRLFFFFKTAFPHYCDCEAHRGRTRSGSSGPGCPASSTRPLHPACSQSLPATFSGCSLNKAFCSVRPGLTQCGSLCRLEACGEVRPPLTDTQVWLLPPMRSAAKSERSDESA